MERKEKRAGKPGATLKQQKAAFKSVGKYKAVSRKQGAKLFKAGTTKGGGWKPY